MKEKSGKGDIWLIFLFIFIILIGIVIYDALKKDSSLSEDETSKIMNDLKQEYLREYSLGGKDFALNRTIEYAKNIDGVIDCRVGDDGSNLVVEFEKGIEIEMLIN